MKALIRQIASAAMNLVYQDFALRHLSGNLMGTMELTYGEDYASLRVPAVKYDLKRWNKDKVIVSQPWLGSYAEKVNVSGGFSRTHQEYAERATIGAIRLCMGANDIKYDIEER